MLTQVNDLLERIVGQLLGSTDIVDIMNMIAVCVVSGNVRRSSELSIGEYDDKRFLTMKDYDLHRDKCMSYRYASNNSINAIVGKTDYRTISEYMLRNGEPGIIWMENIRKYGRTQDPPDYKDTKAMGINPCGEQTLESNELCCLVETFPSRHTDVNDFIITLKYALIYAKTVTLIPTHWDETNKIMKRNRRLGISQSGITSAFTRHGRRTMISWSDKGYQYLKQTDRLVSNWLQIPESIKLTSVKPSGTVSLLPGEPPGIHYPHSNYYIRRVRVSPQDPILEPIIKAGYHIEDDVYGNAIFENKKTQVISFPIMEYHFDRKKSDVTIWEQLSNCADYQRWWADNNISITVTLRRSEYHQDGHLLVKGEEDDLFRALEVFEDKLKSVTFLPYNNNGYLQAPYEEITQDQYQDMIKDLKPIDFSNLTNQPIGERYCDTDACLT